MEFCLTGIVCKNVCQKLECCSEIFFSVHFSKEVTIPKYEYSLFIHLYIPVKLLTRTFRLVLILSILLIFSSFFVLALVIIIVVDAVVIVVITRVYNRNLYLVDIKMI